MLSEAADRPPEGYQANASQEQICSTPPSGSGPSFGHSAWHALQSQVHAIIPASSTPPSHRSVATPTSNGLGLGFRPHEIMDTASAAGTAKRLREAGGRGGMP
jgi:hypothetical protein